MTEPQPAPASPPAKPATFLRFTLDERIEHVLIIVSFSLLGLTGLIQKFSQAPLSQWLIAVLGGIETVRIIHRTSAILMTAEAIYHAAAVAYRLIVLRASFTMLPGVQDIVHVIQDVLCYLGLRRHTARYGRYTYAEKAEYLAMVWGTMIMGLTGFLMWNPIASTRWLPGEFVPAAKAAHGGEAILAVLAIFLWHFYHVHLKQFNKSMFLGRLTREEMEHEHPAELAQIEAGRAGGPRVPPAVLRRRQKVFFPVAGVIVLALSGGLYWAATFESRVITTISRGETAAVFVPFTPTPSPVPTSTATPLPPTASLTWQDGLGQLFADRCGSCHGATKAGGLSVLTYVETIQGGSRGPGIVLGKPDESTIVQIQRAGGHPGQFSADELARVIEWIKLGAVEK
jgi:cytochrome b subunit of formate dehydrogenase